MMDVQEEIFEDFFNKLEAAKLPTKLVMGLRKLQESNELTSQEKILKTLKEAIENAKDKDV